MTGPNSLGFPSPLGQINAGQPSNPIRNHLNKMPLLFNGQFFFIMASHNKFIVSALIIVDY